MKTSGVLRRLDLLFRITGTVSVMLFLAIVSGCGSTKVSTQTNSSVGQQLLDLQKAHDQGIINDQEYERLRKAVVKKND